MNHLTFVEKGASIQVLDTSTNTLIGHIRWRECHQGYSFVFNNMKPDIRYGDRPLEEIKARLEEYFPAVPAVDMIDPSPATDQSLIERIKSGASPEAVVAALNEDVVINDIWLCEQSKIRLRPGFLYRLTVDPTCPDCRKEASLYE